MLRPHGVRGDVLVAPDSDRPDRFVVGARFAAAPRGSETPEPGEHELAAARRHGEALVIRFSGCADRSAAERLRGHTLLVERSTLPRPPADHYYHYELVGCRCRDQDGGDLGLVVAVVEGGGGHLLEIATAGRRLLVPFVAAHVRRVDPGAAIIELALPEGLIEACGST